MYTPRANFIRFFQNRPCEWVPTSFDMLPFRPEMLSDNIARGTIAQQRPYDGAFGGKDSFGVDWFFEEAVGGSIEKRPLFENIEDWDERVSFPDFDALDWERCAFENREYLSTDRLICSSIFSGYFERLISFIGFENASVALVDPDQQEDTSRLFSRLTDTYIELIRLMRRYFRVELVELHDDWGTQISTIFSPAAHEKMMLPHIRRLAEAAHQEGVLMEQHSCGKIDSLVPNIIRSGVDTWRGQDITDKKSLVDQYGDRFRFGVMLRLEGAVSDGELRRLVSACLDSYRDKRIWLTVMSRQLSPTQKDMLCEYIRGLGVKSPQSGG